MKIEDRGWISGSYCLLSRKSVNSGANSCSDVFMATTPTRTVLGNVVIRSPVFIQVLPSLLTEVVILSPARLMRSQEERPLKKSGVEILGASTRLSSRSYSGETKAAGVPRG